MSVIKDYFFTVILILLIALLLGGAGFFVYKKIVEYTNNSDEKTAFVQNIDSKYEDEPESENVKKQKRDTSVIGKVGPNQETLQKIANTFNNLDQVEQMRKLGTETFATASENRITVSIVDERERYSVDFWLSGHVLVTVIEFDNYDSRISSLKEKLAKILSDCVCQVYGYQEGTFYRVLADYNSRDFELDKEGIEMGAYSEDGSMYETDVYIEFDLNSDLSILENY